MFAPVRQLLAVIDGTDGDAEVVHHATAIAAAAGGRIGFVELRGTPSADPGTDRSRRRERMAKALAAAHALGVPVEAWAPAADAAAAVLRARTRRCDLLVTASTALAERCARSGQAALVAAGAASALAMRVSAALHAEHRRQADAVHRALQQLAGARRRPIAVEVAAMRAALAELHAAARHHELEERVLFPALRRRSRAWDAELDELSRQHRREAELLDALGRAAQGLEAPVPAARSQAAEALLEGMQAYAAFVWEHQGREEGVVLPAARRCLRDESWAAVDAAWREAQREAQRAAPARRLHADGAAPCAPA